MDRFDVWQNRILIDRVDLSIPSSDPGGVLQIYQRKNLNNNKNHTKDQVGFQVWKKTIRAFYNIPYQLIPQFTLDTTHYKFW